MGSGERRGDSGIEIEGDEEGEECVKEWRIG